MLRSNRPYKHYARERAKDVNYRLYLLPKVPFFDQKLFRAYFSDRAHYSFDPSGRIARYDNQNTATDFTFTCIGGVDDEPDGHARIRFQVHSFRPHVFGLEAVPEFLSIAEMFDCEIRDPGMRDAMWTTPSEERFLLGFDRANLTGYKTSLGRYGCADVQRALTSDGTTQQSATSVLGAGTDKTAFLVVGSTEIKLGWLWNYARESIEQDVVSDDDKPIVPRIFWGRLTASDTPVRLVAWGDSVDMLVPAAVTHVLFTPSVVPKQTARMSDIYRQRTDINAVRSYIIAKDRLIEAVKATRHEWCGQGYWHFKALPDGLDRSTLAGFADDWPRNNARTALALYPADHLLDEDLVRSATRSVN